MKRVLVTMIALALLGAIPPTFAQEATPQLLSVYTFQTKLEYSESISRPDLSYQLGGAQ